MNRTEPWVWALCFCYFGGGILIALGGVWVPFMWAGAALVGVFTLVYAVALAAFVAISAVQGLLILLGVKVEKRIWD